MAQHGRDAGPWALLVFKIAAIGYELQTGTLRVSVCHLQLGSSCERAAALRTISLNPTLLFCAVVSLGQGFQQPAALGRQSHFGGSAVESRGQHS